MPEESVHPASLELEAQLRRLETIADPASRSTATDLVAAVLQFHTAALQRMLELIDASEGAAAVLSGFDRDPLIRSMLLVHDLHPDSFTARVNRAVADLEPTIQKRGAKLELTAIEDGIVKIAIKAGPDTHGPLSPMVEKAIRAAAPEAEQVVIEETGGPPPAGFVPLDSLLNPSPAAFAGPTPK